MRRVRKAGLEGDLGDRNKAVFQKKAGISQPRLQDEAFRRHAYMLLEKPRHFRRHFRRDIPSLAAFDQHDRPLDPDVAGIAEGGGTLLVEGAHAALLGQGKLVDGLGRAVGTAMAADQFGHQGQDRYAARHCDAPVVDQEIIADGERLVRKGDPEVFGMEAGESHMRNS